MNISLVQRVLENKNHKKIPMESVRTLKGFLETEYVAYQQKKDGNFFNSRPFLAIIRSEFLRF